MIDLPSSRHFHKLYPSAQGCFMDLFSYPFISSFPAELIRVFQGYREFYDPARITGRKIRIP
jgi:hypothetical protein